MTGDATEELKKRGLDWKEEMMELISWGFYEETGDIHLEHGGKTYVIKEVATLQPMGALISIEADSISALKYRMNKAEEALWMHMNFFKKKKKQGTAEGRTHKR